MFFIMKIFIFHDIHEKCDRFYGKNDEKNRKSLGLKEKASYARFFLPPKGRDFSHLYLKFNFLSNASNFKSLAVILKKLWAFYRYNI